MATKQTCYSDLANLIGSECSVVIHRDGWGAFKKLGPSIAIRTQYTHSDASINGIAWSNYVNVTTEMFPYES